VARATAGVAAGVVVASEPCDDEPGWAEVPDRQLLTATAGTLSCRPLAIPQSERTPSQRTQSQRAYSERTDEDVSTKGIVTA
jgi:glutamine amidotransferase